MTDSVRSPLPPNRKSWITRYWSASSQNITIPTNGCAVTFWYGPDAGDLHLEPNVDEQSLYYQHSENGTSWTPGNQVDDASAAANKLTGSVSSFSIHTGFSQSPTAVTLDNMQAVADPAIAQILVTWETAQETDNLGFNLWRGAAPRRPECHQAERRDHRVEGAGRQTGRQL